MQRLMRRPSSCSTPNEPAGQGSIWTESKSSIPRRRSAACHSGCTRSFVMASNDSPKSSAGRIPGRGVQDRTSPDDTETTTSIASRPGLGNHERLDPTFDRCRRRPRVGALRRLVQANVHEHRTVDPARVFSNELGRAADLVTRDHVERMRCGRRGRRGSCHGVSIARPDRSVHGAGASSEPTTRSGIVLRDSSPDGCGTRR